MPDSYEQQLEKAIIARLDEFNRNRVNIIEAAYQHGGANAVKEIETWHDELRSCYYAILEKELKTNHPRYKELTKAAIAEADSLKEDLQDLNDIASTIKVAASLVSIVARILVLL